MNVRNIKKYLVREVGHLILHYSHHKNRVILSTLLQDTDGFILHFDYEEMREKNYLRFTFCNHTAVEETDVDAEFEHVMAVDIEAFASIRSAVINSIGKLWYIQDEYHDTESVEELLARENAQLTAVGVAKNGFLNVDLATANKTDEEYDSDFVLNAYIPEDRL